MRRAKFILEAITKKLLTSLCKNDLTKKNKQTNQKMEFTGWQTLHNITGRQKFMGLSSMAKE